MSPGYHLRGATGYKALSCVTLRETEMEVLPSPKARCFFQIAKHTSPEIEHSFCFLFLRLLFLKPVIYLYFCLTSLDSLALIPVFLGDMWNGSPNAALPPSILSVHLGLSVLTSHHLDQVWK